jgi:hypothetical protein
VRPVFPSLSVEKEFYQTFEPDDVRPVTNGLVFEVFRQAEHLYLAREMCWVLQINGVDSFILVPASLTELTGLIAALGPTAPDDVDFDIVTGSRGPVAPRDACNGLRLPTVHCDQVVNITRGEFIRILVAHLEDQHVSDSEAQDAFDHLIPLTYNTGETDEHRAINFLLLKYLGVYATTITKKRGDCDLLSVAVEPSRVQGTRRILDVIFTYQHRTSSAIEREFCRVDVSGAHPYLVTGMTTYYLRP